MSRGHRPARSEDEDADLDDEAAEEEEEPSPRRRGRPAPSRRTRGAHRPPPRRWRGPDDDEEDDDEEDEEDDLEPGQAPASWRGSGPRRRPPVFWRARDSLYFEPLVGVAIIVVLLVGLYAYTGNWPPVYVVESSSMQHGTDDVLGLLNTGDLVLAQKTSSASVTTYIAGMGRGYQTYGEYGDVLLYHPNGDTSVTPVIHRAILFLEWSPGTGGGPGSYSAPELAALPAGSCGGSNAVYSTPGTPQNCGTTGLTGELYLYHIGWRSATVAIDLSSPSLGQHSGYLTMGDNNVGCGGLSGSVCFGIPDQNGTVSSLVEPGWILGLARGMIPWFGALKLLLVGNTADVPSQSWEFLGLTIAGVILLAFGIHYALRAEGIETPLRKEEEEEAEARHGSSSGPRTEGGRSWFHRRDRADEVEDEEDEIDPAVERSRRSNARSVRSSPGGRRGRPRPRVRRSTRHRRDEDL